MTLLIEVHPDERATAAEDVKARFELAAALARLPDLSTGELRAEWQRLHGAPPSARLSPDRLRRGIGYALQEATRLPIDWSEQRARLGFD